MAQFDYKTPSDPEASSEPNALSHLEVSLEQDAPSESAANTDGVPVSVRSLLNWEAVTMLDDTIVDLPRVVLVARVGVQVPGGS